MADRPNKDERQRPSGRRNWSETWGGYGLGAIILAYFASPALKYADARMLLIIGVFLGIGVALWFDAWPPNDKSKKELMLWGAAAISLATIATFHQLHSIIYAIDANDRRCLAIQRDMLASQPRRTDGPDLFQSLGCRPQGVGVVYSKPTKLERAAGHALPEGGRR